MLLEKPEGLQIQQARREGSAVQAGLSALDVIVAIDGLKATIPLMAAYAKQAKSYTVHAFRRDELMQFEVQATEVALTEIELNVLDQQKLAKWL